MELRASTFLLIFLLLVFVLLCEPYHLHADKGGIPSSLATIYEPGQYAIISWYGGEEVLYLSSTIRTDSLDEIKIMEVIPLPSIPQIALGDSETFEKLSEIVNNYYTSTYLGGEKGAEGGGVSIIFSKILGPHNVTVFKVSNVTEFRTSLHKIANQNGFELEYDLTSIMNKIKFYLKKNYNIFVVDIISLSAEDGTKTIKPIIYKFKSPKIYYPMVISSINEGSYSIKLFFITSYSIRENMHSSTGASLVSYFEKAVWRWEIESVDKRLTEVFPFWKLSLHLTYIELYGYYDHIQDDIEIQGPFDYSILSSLVVLLIIIAYVRNMLRFTRIWLDRSDIRMKRERKYILFYSTLILIPILVVYTEYTHIIMPPLIYFYHPAVINPSTFAFLINIALIIISTAGSLFFWEYIRKLKGCLLYTSPSPRDRG